MPSYNRVILLGNLTRDPELKYTQNNTAVVNCGLAINRKYKDAQGNKQEEVTFVDWSAFGRVADIVNQYVGKGDPIHIEGRLRLDQWQTNEGENRQKLKVVAENVQLLGSKQDGGGQTQQQSQPSGQSGGGSDPLGDDIPFALDMPIELGG